MTISLPKLCAACLAAITVSTCLAQRFKPVDDNGVWWLENSQGQKVFVRGVCVVDPGTSWNDYDLSNPSYAGFHYYPNKAAWAQDAVSNLQSWGFNTIGAWSSYSDLLAVKDNYLYMTPIIHMGSAAGAPWLDMWDPNVYNLMDKIAKDLITSLKNDPRIIGYFSDNEMGWWKPALFHWIWTQKTFGTRERTAALFQKHYGTWAKFTQDFEVDGANSFEGLKRKGTVYMRPGAKGIGAVSEVLGMLAQRYYSLCKSILHKYDPGALFLGDRYISNYYPEVAKEAGRYCDVVSTNLNPDWTDGGFVRFHLNSLAALTHRPLMVTEYYMTAKENRTGDKDDSSGFPVVQTQKERAVGFTNATTGIAKYPALVGAHWFQYYDEPQNGRGDGEDYDFGLVDIYNKPYEELIAASKALDLNEVHSHARLPEIGDTVPEFGEAGSGEEGGVSSGAARISGPSPQGGVTHSVSIALGATKEVGVHPPPAPPSREGRSSPQNHVDIDQGGPPPDLLDMTKWNRDAAFVPAQESIPLADLYATWTPDNLDLSVYWHEDRFDDQYYKSGKIPDSDRTTLTVTVSNSSLRWLVRMDDKGATILEGPKWAFSAIPGTASHLIFQIPSQIFGGDKLAVGQRVQVNLKLVSESRAYTTKWALDRRLG